MRIVLLLRTESKHDKQKTKWIQLKTKVIKYFPGVELKRKERTRATNGRGCQEQEPSGQARAKSEEGNPERIMNWVANLIDKVGAKRGGSYGAT